MPEFKKVAVFGSGQVSRSIVNALAQCHKQEFHVIQVLPPWHQPPDGQNENSINSSDSRKVETYYLDVTRASQAELVPLLTGVDAVVSTLEGAALRAQRAIQDAAAVTGVKRFYPSEFGMHHIYNKPGDDLGYLHPVCSASSFFHANNSRELSRHIMGRFGIINASPTSPLSNILPFSPAQ